MNWLIVILGAAVGAALRYLTDRAVRGRHSTPFPCGTLTVDVVASLVLGLVTGAVDAGSASPHIQLLIGTGLCATLSTYSTFSFETVRLGQADGTRWAAANIAISVLDGLGAASADVAIGRAVEGPSSPTTASFLTQGTRMRASALRQACGEALASC